MSGKKKVAVFLCTLVGMALLALYAAIPYGYFVQILALASDSPLADVLCWGLYLFVATLLWLVVWRAVSLAVRRWPGRK